jgi:hypothetical protein
MSIKSIDASAKNPEKISLKLERVSFSSVRKTLPDIAIIQACKAAGYRQRA